MGLFKKKNKAQSTASNPGSSDTEFDRDIGELLTRDDVGDREAICKIEYKKAKSLLEGQPTEERVHRAYDIMGQLASKFDYVPAILWMGNFVEDIMQQPSKAVFWYKKAAELGDGQGARCYADMLTTGNGVSRDPKLAMHYYTTAADKGIPEAAFVLGEIYRNSGDREKAIAAYKKAERKGYEDAKARLKQMGAE